MVDFQEHSLTIAFYIFIILFVFFNRKHFDIHGKIIALYRTQKGVRWMERLAARYTELVKLLGYIGVGLGFTAMLVMIGLLLQGVYNLFFVENALPTLSPVLPGIPVPGGIHIPLVQGLLAIFIVAVIHEFSHGVVAFAHKVKVKSAGPAIFGPFFAAFVEPDEKQLKEKDDIVQYSMFAAGSFSNMLLALFFFVILIVVISPLTLFFYPADGVVFENVETPAIDFGVESNITYTTFNDVPIKDDSHFIALLGNVSINETIVLIDETGQERTVSLGEHPDIAGRAYLGVRGVDTSFTNQESIGFIVLNWIFRLFSLIVGLSLGIGLANLLPVGPLDGGRMFLLASERIFGEKKGKKIWAAMSFFILAVVLVLLSPIFSAIFSPLLSFLS